MTAADTIREALAIAWPEGDHAEPNIYTESLAALDALEADRDRLAEERNEYMKGNLWVKEAAKERERAEAAEAERDRRIDPDVHAAEIGWDGATTALQRCEAERDELRSRVANDPAITWHVNLAALEAERDRLREALQHAQTSLALEMYAGSRSKTAKIIEDALADDTA